MRILTTRDDFYTAVLGPADFRTFCTAHNFCWEVDFTDKDWTPRWTDPDLHTVVLFKRRRIAGMADIKLDGRLAMLSWVAMARDLRGQRLIDMVYEGSLMYIACNSNCIDMTLDTDYDNNASIRAAERNGFQWDRSIESNYYALSPLVYTRSLEDVRKKYRSTSLDLAGPNT